MVQKSFLAVLCLLLLSNCSTKGVDKPIVLDTAPIAISIEQPKQPSSIVLSNINWKILNIDNNIYYGLSVTDYELLASNMLDIKRYILAQKNIITYYEDVTK